jgi:hypothetical protein
MGDLKTAKRKKHLCSRSLELLRRTVSAIHKFILECFAVPRRLLDISLVYH